MQIAIYARVSNEGQADRRTIEAQVDFLQRYADLNSLDIVREYRDEAVTGSTPLTQRPEGIRMIQDAKAKRFEAVVIYRVDRCARSLRELLEAQVLLDELGAALRSATEPFDTATPMGRFMFQLLGDIAELEKSTIIERTMAGKRGIAREGKWHGGGLPYGYGIVGGFLLPRESEASVVREWCRRVAAGSTLVAERNRLHAEGITPKRGGRQWHQARLSRIFTNLLYFGGRHGIPALVDRELWEAARARIKRNYTRKDTKRFNLLRSKLRCQECRSTFVVVTRKNGPAYYRCASQAGTRAKPCKAVQIRAEPLEGYAWAECAEMLQHPEMLTQLGLDHYEYLSDPDANVCARSPASRRYLRSRQRPNRESSPY